MTARNYTAELRRAQAAGARVVCSLAPFHGRAVFYAPRSQSDPLPWRLAGDLATNGYRYSGRECHTMIEGERS
jgi:hypothetical protein